MVGRVQGATQGEGWLGALCPDSTLSSWKLLQENAPQGSARWTLGGATLPRKGPHIHEHPPHSRKALCCCPHPTPTLLPRTSMLSTREVPPATRERLGVQGTNRVAKTSSSPPVRPSCGGQLLPGPASVSPQSKHKESRAGKMWQPPGPFPGVWALSGGEGARGAGSQLPSSPELPENSLSPPSLCWP